MEVINILSRAIDDAEQFRALLSAQANMHADYEHLCSIPRAAQGAGAQKNACLRAYDWIGRDDLSIGERAHCIAAETGTLVVALNAAAKMLGVAPAQRTAALVAWEARA